MSTNPTTRNTMRGSVAPNLNISPSQYDYAIEEAFKTQLRLYFAQVDNITNGILAPAGGRFFSAPIGIFTDTTTQVVAGANVLTPIAFGTTGIANNVSVQSGSLIKVEYTGIYKVSVSITVQNATSCGVWLWLRENTTVIPGSVTYQTLPTTVADYVVTTESIVTLQGNETIEAVFTSTDAATQLNSIASSGDAPTVNTAKLVITFESAIPA